VGTNQYRQPRAGQLSWLPDIFKSSRVFSKIQFGDPSVSIDKSVWLIGKYPNTIWYQAPQGNPTTRKPPCIGWQAVDGQPPAPQLAGVYALQTNVSKL